MRISLRWLLPVGAIVAALALVLAWMNTSGTGAKLTASSSTQPAFQAVCPPATPGTVTCFSIRRTMVPHAATPNALPAGLHPADLRSAYKMPSSVPGAGRPSPSSTRTTTRTPRPTSPLPQRLRPAGVHHRQRLLPQGQRERRHHAAGGRTPAGPTEISLDLDMVSAICPSCHILLVEANSAQVKRPGHGGQHSGAARAPVRRRNSYGGAEYQRRGRRRRPLLQPPGRGDHVRSGDTGYGVESTRRPRSTSPRSAAPRSTGRQDRAAGRDGRGPAPGSAAPPTRQAGLADTTRAAPPRTVADVSAVADPHRRLGLRHLRLDPAGTSSAARASRRRSSPRSTRWPPSRAGYLPGALPLHPPGLL